MVNIVINQEIEFLEEKSAWQGVKRVAGYVRNDMEKVFGTAFCRSRKIFRFFLAFTHRKCYIGRSGIHSFDAHGLFRVSRLLPGGFS